MSAFNQDDMQALVAGLGAQWQRERSKTQMTLGAMIEALESLSPDSDVTGLWFPHSYRGYYCDLAFEARPEPVKAGSLLTECRNAMGKVFEGYKGGDFVMGALTPVWVARYGSCGQRLMAIRADGAIETADDEL